MNITNFTNIGGFPLEVKTLDGMQNAYLQILTALIGHFGLTNTGSFIIDGCQIVGTTITPGMLYIDGKLCPFAGAVGSLTTRIAKIENIESVTFESGASYPTYFQYTAAENSAGMPLSSFARLPKVPELVNVATAWADITGKPNVVIDPAVAPAPSLMDRIIKLEEQNKVFQAGGGMVLWNKPANQIPTNWQEVVNWKGRIPVGVDNTLDALGNMVSPEFAPMTNGQNDPGRIGGSKTKTLTISEIPPHTHEVPVFANGSASGNADGHPDNWIDSNRRITTLPTGGVPGGGTAPFSILNPFRTVLFIEYIR